jgi:4-amino-4-deoxy-L-arabinose transferase-like glycosyltransferase
MKAISGTGLPAERSRSFTQLLPLAAIALLLALLTLNRLGAADVCGGNEAAMAVYVQQMIGGRQLLFPLDNCSIPMYKPPLYHWTAATLAFILHQAVATPFNLRLPSALYAIAGAVLTMVFATKLLGPRGAILSGLILCGSYQYVSDARIGLVDMTLTFFETLALFTFFGWFLLESGTPEERARCGLMHYLLAIAMGLAVLAKGPVGAILPGTAMLLFLITEKNRTVLKALFRPGPLVAGGAIGLSWYIACLVSRRFDFLSLQLGSENFGRFFGSLGTMAPWYYLRPLFLNSVPFSLFVPVAVIAALRRPVGTRACSDEELYSQTDLRQGERAASAARLLALFWLCTVIFFEFASYKRRAYLLPLWPASALLLAWWIVDRVIPRLTPNLGMRVYRTAVASAILLALANLVFIPARELHACGAPFTSAELLRWPSAGFAGESSMDSGQRESYRKAALRINQVTGSSDALYEFGLRDALEPLVFYLDRCVRPLHSPREVPSASYVIASESAWERANEHLSDLAVVARIPYDGDDLILLRANSSGMPEAEWRRECAPSAGSSTIVRFARLPKVPVACRKL